MEGYHYLFSGTWEDSSLGFSFHSLEHFSMRTTVTYGEDVRTWSLGGNGLWAPLRSSHNFAAVHDEIECGREEEEEEEDKGDTAAQKNPKKKRKTLRHKKDNYGSDELRS